jgi:hypothetical protein
VPEEPKAIGRGLSSAAATSSQHSFIIRDTLREAANSNGVRQSVAANLLYFGESFGATIPGLPDDMSRYVDIWRYKHPTGAKVKVGQLLRQVLARAVAGEDYPAHDVVDEALRECDQLVLRRTASGDLWSVTSGKAFNCAGLHAALNDPDATLVLEIALDSLKPEDWAARSMLARAYWPTAARWPIGSRLRSTTPDLAP